MKRLFFATAVLFAAAAQGQTYPRLPSASGSAESMIGSVGPGKTGIGRIYDAPPVFSPEMKKAIEEAQKFCTRDEEDELEERVDPSAPPPSVGNDPPTPVPNPVPPGGFGQRAPETFHVWRTTTPQSIAPSISTTTEPSAAGAYDQIFMTGNWFAALSLDGGLTWRYLNPYDNFPADGTTDDPGSLSGVFCCDQNAYYIPSRDLWVWQLQYVVGGNSNVQRLAFFHGRDAMANNSYCFYDFSPQSFGYASTGFWLDFPDIATGQDYMYLTTNIFAVGAGSTSTCGMLRLPLDPISTCSGFGFSYYVDTAHPGFRMAHGSTTTMYFASHHTTSTLRIYRWPENSGTISWDDVGHATYNSGAYTATTNDGNNWAGNGSPRVLGAYRANGELGFMWHVPQDAANGRPYPRTLVKRFRESDRALTGEQEVWNPNIAFMYPSVHPNNSGEWGGTIHYGGGATYPTTAAWIADTYNGRSMAPMTLAYIAGSDSAPASNRYGDYYETAKHWLNGNTWIGTGHTISGGTVYPWYFWFGREANTPPADMDARSANALGSSFRQGQSISVTYNAANIGAQTATSVVLDFRASTNNIISSGDYPLGTVSVGSLGAGGATSGTFIGSMPFNVPVGTYYIGYFISSASDGYFGNNDAYDAGTVSVTLANDSCAFALPATIGTFTGDTTNASLDGGASCVSTTNRDVWYSFTPSCTGVYRIDTCGSVFDTVLSVHSGCPGTAANAIICDDDNGGPGGASGCSVSGLNSAVNVFLQQGTPYLVRIAGFSTGASGAYTLNIAQVAPSNDSCAAAQFVTDGDYEFSNCLATSDFNSTAACRTGYNDVWFTYLASCDGSVNIATCDSDFDTVLMVYPYGACPIASTPPLACDDDLCATPNGLGSSVSFSTTAGQYYRVRVGGFSSVSRGGGRIHFECAPICSACVADYNQDGGVDGADVGAFFDDWEGGTGCADVNQDGGIDGSDVSFFFDAWELGVC